MERREPLVHQYFIDHDLCKQRRDQGKKLKKERGNQHFAEERAVFDDGRDEPGEIKFQVLRTNHGPLRKEQQFSGRCAFELLAGENARSRLDGILHEYLFTFDFREDDITPIPLLRHGRQRRPGKCAPRDFEQTGLQSHVFGGTEQIGVGQDLSRLRKLMP